MMQDEFGIDEGQDSRSRHSSFAYPSVDVDEVEFVGAHGGNRGGAVDQAKHYKHELRLLEEKKHTHDSEMRQMLELERIKSVKAQA